MTISIDLTPSELFVILRGDNNDGVNRKLDLIITQNEELKRMTTETQALLDQIDTTTNVIAGNVQAIASTTSTISGEIDVLIAQSNDPVLIAKLTDFSSRLSGVADASNSQVTILQAIAAKGAPVVPPTPAVVSV